jgi:hypothetical protein
MHTFTTLKCTAGISGWYDQARKISNNIWIANAEIKLSLFSEDTITYIEIPKESIKKLALILKILINIQKSFVQVEQP